MTRLEIAVRLIADADPLCYASSADAESIERAFGLADQILREESRRQKADGIERVEAMAQAAQLARQLQTRFTLDGVSLETKATE